MEDRTGLTERQRQDKEQAEQNLKRQTRQGVVSVSEENAPPPPKPKTKSSAKKT